MSGLQIEELRVRLGRREVLRGLSFDAPRAQVTALLGPNGAGKTTCLKALLGLVPARGRLLLDGEALGGLTPAERALRVGYVPQRSLLSAALSARAVVEQGRFLRYGVMGAPGPDDREAVDEALRWTRAEHLAERAFTRLSGGEQQRILLARALATGARTVLLDEPTSALDVSQSLSMVALLRRLAEEGRCVVVVLHDLDEARRCADRAVLLDGGRLVAAGPSAEIIAPPPVRAVYGVELIEGAGLGYRLPEGG